MLRSEVCTKSQGDLGRVGEMMYLPLHHRVIFLPCYSKVAQAELRGISKVR